jgi:hypothetical protein
MKEKEILFKEMQDELFHVNGEGWHKIMSGSMHPLININDRVLVKKADPFDVKKRDIILFKSDGVLVTHRVITFKRQDGKMMILQKGDASPYAQVIPPESVMGKVVVIEKRGRFVRLDSGRGRIVNGLLGFKASASCRSHERLAGIKEWFRNKPGFFAARALYRNLLRPARFLNRVIVKMLLST